MASVTAEVRHEWQRLKHDPPGKRFENHRDRMKQGSSVLMVGRALLGLALIAAGVVLLFIPGPGLLVMVFGLALFAGMSTPLARLMDRAEPVLRRWFHSAKERWHAMSTPGKAALLAVVGVIALAAIYGMYRMWFA